MAAAAAATTAAAGVSVRFFCGGYAVGYFYYFACLFIHNISTAVISIFHIYILQNKKGQPRF